jgi:hypothetical protein
MVDLILYFASSVSFPLLGLLDSVERLFVGLNGLQLRSIGVNRSFISDGYEGDIRTARRCLICSFFKRMASMRCLSSSGESFS